MGGFLYKSISTENRVDNKTIIITGANVGIGLETAAALYARGGRVILACRDMMKADLAKKEIISRYLGDENVGSLETVRCDLSSQKSVRDCAEELLKNEPKIDILINNAGVMMCPYQITEDGYELQLATNHLGHFLFTLLLLPRILKVAEEKPNSDPSRIINLSSVAHTFISEFDFDDLHYKNNYNPRVAYYKSKAANIFFTKSLAKRLEGKNVKVYAVHPGIVDTPLWKHSDNAFFPGLPFLMRTVASLFIKSPLQGAQTTLHCALTDEAALESGLYYSNCRKKRTSAYIQDEFSAEKLFNLSLGMTKIDLTAFDAFTAET